MKPGRPLAYGRIGGAHFFGLPGNPVSVMVTFYQFVRDALLKLGGRDPVPPLPTFKVPCTSALKKAPGRARNSSAAYLTQDADGAWSVRVTGEQGSGILRSMTEAQLLHHPADRSGQRRGRARWSRCRSWKASSNAFACSSNPVFQLRPTFNRFSDCEI